MKMNNFERLSLKSIDITDMEELKMDAAACMESGNEKMGNCDFKNAIADYQKAIEIEPDNYVAYYQWGLAQKNLNVLRELVNDDDSYRNGDFKEIFRKVIDITSEIIKNNSQDINALMYRGNAKQEIFAYSEAIEDYSMVIEIEPDNHSVYDKRAMAKQELNDNLGAIDDYSKAIEKCNDNSYLLEYYLFRGYAKIDINDDAGAIQDYLKAIDINPDYPIPYTWLGKIYCWRKEYSKAVEYLEMVKIEHWSESEFIRQDYSEEEWDELLKFKTNKTTNDNLY